jgi:hypothetical protein
MMNVPTLYLGVLGSLEPSPWSLSGSNSGLSPCTFGFTWEECNGVPEFVGSANGGELMLEEPSQQNRQIFQMLKHLLMEELMLKEGDQPMG